MSKQIEHSTFLLKWIEIEHTSMCRHYGYRPIFFNGIEARTHVYGTFGMIT